MGGSPVESSSAKPGIVSRLFSSVKPVTTVQEPVEETADREPLQDEVAVFLETDDFSSSEDLSVTETPKQRQSKRPGHKKSVSFASLDIREYNIVIGDHPCCTMGCPLSLGWEYSESSSLSLDQYEATRSPRRNRRDLRTTCEQRRQILSEDGEVSELEMRRAQRKLHRARSCSAKLCERMNASFFREVERDLLVVTTNASTANQA